jgi:hypothetical protein
MKKSTIISIAFLALVSAGNIFAGEPKASEQLALQAPQRDDAAVMPDAQADNLTVVVKEKGQPARTIYFETDKGNPLFDIIFGGGGNGNNNGHNDGYGSYGRLNCVASDEGWEEHWGGHGGGPSEIRACRECLAVHGGCRFSCSTEQFRCTAQFIPAAAPGQPQPAPSTYPGDPRPDQGSAQDSATLRCMQSTQGQQGYCTIQNCARENQVAYSGRCRK